MPNWCMNQLILTGPKDVIFEIAESKLSLDKLFPCPQELKDTTAPAVYNDKERAVANKEKFGFSDWYDWQISNWGTKWDIGPLEEIDPDQVGDNLYEINVGFDSAWSPPVEAMSKLYDKYGSRGLNIWMEYFEPGCAFLGTVTTTGGQFIDEYREFSTADELEEAVKELEHGLAESEVEYLREREEEEHQFQIEKAAKANAAPAKTKAAKPTAKKAAKKPVKKVAKKPVKKSTAKATKKPAKKPVKAKTSTKKSK